MKTPIQILVLSFIMVIVSSTVTWGNDFEAHQSGPWASSETWQEYYLNAWHWPATHPPSSADGGIYIGAGHTVTVNTNVTVDQLTIDGGSLVVSSNSTLTIADGPGIDLLSNNNGSFVRVDGTLVNNGQIQINFGGLQVGTIVNNGTLVIGGTFTFNQGLVTGNSLTYGSNATLVVNHSADSTSIANFWPGTNGPSNLFVSAGGVMLKTPRTVNRFYLSDTMDCSNLTVNVSLKLQPGALVTGAPIYGSSSQLWYHTGGTYSRSAEWSADSGAGYPANVYIQNTILDYPNGSRDARALSGDLEIAGALRMDYGSVGVNNPLTVGGDVILRGTLALGDAPGGDLHVRGGEWIHGISSFMPNSRAVIFDGVAEQIISGSPVFDDLTMSNLAGVKLFGGSSMTVNQRLTFTTGNLVLSAGTLTLAGKVLGASNAHHTVTPGLGRIQRFIAGQDSFQFPIGPTATSYNPVTITNLSTNTELVSFRAGVKDSISYPLPLAAGVLRREWKLDASIFGGVEARLTFQWETSDPVIGQFNPAEGVAIGRFDGSQSKWIETAAIYDPGPPRRATASFAGFVGGEFIIGNLGSITDVTEEKIPKAFALHQNYPNPFNPSTTIRFDLPRSDFVTLKVYDLLGKEVVTLLSEKQVVGEHIIRWNPVGLSSGIYFYRLQTEEFVATKKLILVQ